MLLLFFLFLWQSSCDASLITSNCELNRSDERLTRISKLPCPSRPVCQCYVGAVDCSGGNLRQLPSSLTETTTLLLNNNSFTGVPEFYMYPDWSNNISILDLSHNKIYYLNHWSFERLDSLQYIDLRYNEISDIWIYYFFAHNILQTPGCFLLGHNSIDYISRVYSRKAIQTQFIDFSFNKISTLSSNNFVDFNFSQISLSGNKLQKVDLNYFYINQQMQQLDVSNNLIVNITNENAIQLSSLKSLNLSHNNLTNIFPNIISQLPTLEEIDLSFNRLSDFESFTSISYLSLRIYAEDNPWECNCNLSALYRQLSGKHTFACRDGGDECLYCATPANLTGVLIQNTCSEPKSRVPTNTQSSNTQPTNTAFSHLETILGVLCGILVTTLLGAGIGWALRQRKLKKCSTITSNSKLKHSNQQPQFANIKAVNSYDSSALTTFKAPPKHNQMMSSNQQHSSSRYQGVFLQVHAKMGAAHNLTAHRRPGDSREIDGIYMNQINLPRRNKLSARDGKHDYVNIDVVTHQAQIHSRNGNEEYYESTSNRVHSSLHRAKNYNLTPGSNLSYCEKEESLYMQPMN